MINAVLFYHNFACTLYTRIQAYFLFCKIIVANIIIGRVIIVPLASITVLYNAIFIFSYYYDYYQFLSKAWVTQKASIGQT